VTGNPGSLQIRLVDPNTRGESARSAWRDELGNRPGALYRLRWPHWSDPDRFIPRLDCQNGRCNGERPEVDGSGGAAQSGRQSQAARCSARQGRFNRNRFFASDAGHVVTNAHVVEGCQTLKSSRGGRLTKVSIDEQSDLATSRTTSRKTSYCAA
jgi:hypothetical protein